MLTGTKILYNMIIHTVALENSYFHYQSFTSKIILFARRVGRSRRVKLVFYIHKKVTLYVAVYIGGWCAVGIPACHSSTAAKIYGAKVSRASLKLSLDR